MKIYVYPADMEGCGYYRLIWPALELKKQGYDVTILKPNERAFNAVMEDDTVLDVITPPDVDVMVFQRITHSHLANAIPVIQRKGIAVVVDVDDDLSAIHQSHPAWVNLHPKSGRPDSVVQQHNWQHAVKACQLATLVTVSSDALLQRYARHGRGVVLNNCVPEGFLNAPRNDSNLIGWGGSVRSHPGDLDQLGRTITRLMREHVPFKIIGPVTGVKDALSLDDDPDHTGTVDIREWPHALATLGIGIAPLADTRFNAAKSWLKPLEYAALGVPCVMSPRAEYQAIYKLGIGLLAEKPKNWYTQLKLLATNDDFRWALSEKGREVAARLTYQENAHKWGKAWVAAGESMH